MLRLGITWGRNLGRPGGTTAPCTAAPTGDAVFTAMRSAASSSRLTGSPECVDESNGQQRTRSTLEACGPRNERTLTHPGPALRTFHPDCCAPAFRTPNSALVRPPATDH